MPKIKVSISVDDAHIGQIQQVSEDLRSVGLDVEQTLPSIGVVGGSIDSDQVDRLYQVEGVQRIESDRGYQLPPPDADVQ